MLLDKVGITQKTGNKILYVKMLKIAKGVARGQLIALKTVVVKKGGK